MWPIAIVAVAAIGGMSLAVGGLIYFAKLAISRADSKGTALAAVATVEGDLKMADEKVKDANDATRQTADALETEEKRGDALEKEIANDASADVAVPDGSGWRVLQGKDGLEDPRD